MHYIVRLNPKALNPFTMKVTPGRMWEVEQCSMMGGGGLLNSEPVIWHCSDVRIDKTPIRELFHLPKAGEKPWEMKCSGVVVRGPDDVIEIRTGGIHAT